MKKFKNIQEGMNSTWQAIGADILDAVGGDLIPKDEVIELVLDANRLDMYGSCDKKELAEFKKLNYKDKMKVANEAFTFDHYGW